VPGQQRIRCLGGRVSRAAHRDRTTASFPTIGGTRSNIVTGESSSTMARGSLRLRPALGMRREVVSIVGAPGRSENLKAGPPLSTGQAPHPRTRKRRGSITPADDQGQRRTHDHFGVRVPLRHFGATTPEPLTCSLARQDHRQGPGDSPAFTPLILALGPL